MSLDFDAINSSTTPLKVMGQQLREHVIEYKRHVLAEAERKLVGAILRGEHPEPPFVLALREGVVSDRRNPAVRMWEAEFLMSKDGLSFGGRTMRVGVVKPDVLERFKRQQFRDKPDGVAALAYAFAQHSPLIEPYSAKWWKCSGCGHMHQGDVGRCKGYCQDSSGQSCDAVACPECGRYHFWTGSFKAEEVPGG